MSKISRRNCIGGTLAAWSGSGLRGATDVGTPLRKGRSSGRGRIQLSELFYPDDVPHKLRLAAQVGITHAIGSVSSLLSKVRRTEYADVLRKVKAGFAAYGMKFAGVESHPVPAEKIKLGLAGRDEEIENYVAVIRAMAEVGVPLICYNWMAGIGWYRTRVDLPGRGGALLSEFDNEQAKREGLTEWGEISEARIWSNLEYFLKAVIPEAEKANVKMALHPDDPPVPPLRGVGRILTSAANYRRVLNLVPSPVNGITFCRRISN
jgi:mannonate dehydratase